MKSMIHAFLWAILADRCKSWLTWNGPIKCCPKCRPVGQDTQWLKDTLSQLSDNEAMSAALDWTDLGCFGTHWDLSGTHSSSQWSSMIINDYQWLSLIDHGIIHHITMFPPWSPSPCRPRSSSPASTWPPGKPTCPDQRDLPELAEAAADPDVAAARRMKNTSRPGDMVPSRIHSYNTIMVNYSG